jgi:anti-sigma B factor antagonist
MGLAMQMINELFAVEWEGPTAIVSPTHNLGELDCDQITEGAEAVLALLDDSNCRNVVVDLGRSDYVGSTALGFFVRLWKRARAQGGRMVLCNVSAHEAEILEVTRLGDLWPTHASREEALRALRALNGSPRCAMAGR